MPLIASPDLLRERAAVVAPGAPLASLAQSLAAELEPVAARDLYVPVQKAVLSRAGGRCPVDGVNLEFDPSSPHAHRCPACGTYVRGELHDRFWIFWYQLWLAERAVHAAALAALGPTPHLSSFAATVLDAYVDAYLRYPNRDNVLGPTRLFFSTYLESIWLLNICIAADLLRQCDAAFHPLIERVRERIVEPSRTVIASYDEGASNRQVWNNAALIAAARLLRRDQEADRAVHARSGLLFHLGEGLLADGTWYEGENYHLFAHRGLWYGVTMAETAGMSIPPVLVRRFQEGFATPFLTALPDLTLPSRRDSQYAISLRQWRFAELCELGLGRLTPTVDARLVYALKRLYQDDVPRAETGRARSTADVERNLAPTRLSRADLGWRCLFHACRDLPPLEAEPPSSVLLEAQGLAVLRREAGRVYGALDYGTSGGGHGHPDRLNLLLFDGDTRWLDDMGTGSYVEPSLHWYRSTLSHNAPLFGARSQERVDGELLAYSEQNGIGWVSAIVSGLAPGVTAVRSLVMTPDYLIDELEWRGPAAAALDLPFHLDAEVERMVTASGDVATPKLVPRILDGSGGLEDGFRFVRDGESLDVPATARLELTAIRRGRTLRGWSSASRPARWYRLVAPGPPGKGDSRFVLWRVDPDRTADSAKEVEGTVRTVLAWSPRVAGVRFDDEIRVLLADGSEERHARNGSAWEVTMQVDSSSGALGRRVVLSGERGALAVGRTRQERARDVDAKRHRLTSTRPLELELGDANYRRSEESWSEAGKPTAHVRIAWKPTELTVDIEVRKEGELTFVAAGTENPYDNEHADINGDGVQLYLETSGGRTAWLLVPDTESEGLVRARSIDDWLTPRDMHATWARTARGYRLKVRIDLPDATTDAAIGLDVIVNEKPVARERRRGQLVLSEAAGEFVYLRGDRHERERLLRLTLAG